MPAEDLTQLLPLPITRLLVGGATELNALVAPLVHAAQHPASLQRLLHQAGWDIEALLAPATHAGFVAAVESLRQGVDTVFGGGDASADTTPPLDVVDVLELGAALGAATAALLDVASALEPTIKTIFEASSDGQPSDAQALATQFVADIADILVVRWLSNASPVLFSIARFSGLISTVRRPALYLTAPADSGDPADGQTDSPLPIRWAMRRLGVNIEGIAQPFLLGLQSFVDELPPGARQSAPGFIRAVTEHMQRRFDELLADLSTRPIGDITVGVDAQGVLLEAPNWLPTAAAGLNSPIDIPLNDHTVADAIPFTLVVANESVRLNWTNSDDDATDDDTTDGIVLIEDTLVLLERFAPEAGGVALAQPGLELNIYATDIDALGIELVLTIGLGLDIGAENSTQLALTASASWDGGFDINFRAEALGLLEIPLVVPGLTGLAIGFEHPVVELSAADLDTDPRLDLEVSVDAFTLNLPAPLFRAVQPSPLPNVPWEFATGAPTVKFTPDDDDDAGTDLPPLLSLGISGGEAGGIDVDRFELLDLGPTWSLEVSAEPFFVGIGDNIDHGVIIELQPSTYTAAPGALGEVAISKALVHLPPDLPVPLEEIIISDATIGEDGFSGEVSFVFAERPEGEDPSKLFGAVDLWFRSISLVIEDNLPTEFDLKADVKIPYFDEIVEVAISFDDDFNLSFTIETAEPEGITLTKDELLLLNFRSAAFDWKSEDKSLALELSGGIEPLLWNADGLEWPRLDVTELRVEQDVQSIIDLDPEPPIIRFREAWLDLKELVTLDLFGFHFELNRIGMGYLEETDELWVDLTGSLRLIELLPVGLGVEGFRITWPRRIYEDLQLDELDELTMEDVLAIASRIQVKFDGIYLFFGIPQTAEFEGFIRFIKTAQKVGFAGDMALRLPSTGLAIEAGLMVGMNFAEPAPYPFLYVYFGIMLPSGIPLGQSGLALKGAKGLFGLNVEPDREPEENPYYDWYQRGPIEGAHPTNKWRDKIWSIAFGAGITITTTDGKILGVQGLLALVIPGPIIFVEGKALIFDGVFPGDSPLKALGYFDGNELTAQLNIEASMELVEGVIDVMAGVEAFFDFRNLLNWHLYAGVDEPKERRIHANVLKMPALGWLFQADAYLMVDMPTAAALDGAPLGSIGLDDLTVRARMGVYIGFEPPSIDLIVASAEVRAVIDGEGLLTINPFIFNGSVGLDAVIDVDAFSLVKVSAEATADMSIDGALPLIIDARLVASVDLPVPDPESVPIIGDHLASVVDWFEETVGELPDVPDHLEVDIPFHWEFDRPPVLDPLVGGVSLDSRFAQGGSSAHRAAGSVSARDVPVVPLDAHPVVAFDQNIGVPDHAEFGGFAAGVVERFFAGKLAFRPMLRSIHLHQLPAEQFVDGTSEDWVEIASTDVGAIAAEVLWGMFRPQGEFTDQARAGRRLLELWGTNPFEFLSRSIPMTVPTDGLTAGVSVSPRESLGLGGIEWCDEFEPERHCIDQKDIGAALKEGLPTVRFVEGTNGWGHVLDLGGLEFRAPDVRLNNLGQFVALELDGPNRKIPFASITFPESVASVELRFVGKNLDVRADRRVLKVEQTVTPSFVGAQVSIRTGDEGAVVVLKIDAADGLDRLRLGARDTIRLVELCWVTAESVAAAAVSRRECAANDAVTERASDPGVVLGPGMHYRVDIETSIELDEGASDATTLALSSLPGFAEAIAQYRVASGGPSIEADTFHFQTAGPPADLSPYVKWTSPTSGAARHFPSDDLVVRFNRPYIHRLFPDPDNGASGPDGSPYELAAVVEDADGRVLTDWFLNWTNAASSTLLPEEAHWFDNIAPVSAPGTTPALDDILEIRRRLQVTGVDAADQWEPVAPKQPVSLQRRVKWKRRDGQVEVATSGAQGIHRYMMSGSTWGAGRVNVEIESGAVAGLVVLESDDGRYEVRVARATDRRVIEIVRVDSKEERTLKSIEVRARAVSVDLAVNIARDDVGVTISCHVAGKELTITDLVPVSTHGSVGLLAGGDATFRGFSIASSEPSLQPSTRYTLRIVGGAGGRIVREDTLFGELADWWTEATGWTATAAGIEAGGVARLQLDEPADDGEFFVDLSLANGGAVRLGMRTPDSRRADGDVVEYGVTVRRDGTRVNCTLAAELATGSKIIASGEAAVNSADRVRLRVRLIGDQASVWVANEQVLDSSLGGHVRSGGLALAALGGGVTLHRVQVREVSLLTVPFTTATQPSFADVVDTIDLHDLDAITSSASASSLTAAIDSALSSQRTWADARLVLHTLERSAALHRTSREELEDQRQTVTSAAHLHDEAMRDLHQTLGAGLLVVPTEPSIQRLSTASGGVVAWVLRSPHPLDPVLRAAGSIAGMSTWGRAVFTLLDDSAELPTAWVSSVDGTTVVVYGIAAVLDANEIADDAALAATMSIDAATKLRVLRHRDHGDDSKAVDHLLDRPYELSRGARSPVVRTITLPSS